MHQLLPKLPRKGQSICLLVQDGACRAHTRRHVYPMPCRRTTSQGWRRRGNKQFGTSQALLGIDDMTDICKHRKVSHDFSDERVVSRSTFPEIETSRDRQAVPRREIAMPRRSGKPASLSERPIRAEGWMCCPLLQLSVQVPGGEQLRRVSLSVAWPDAPR